MSSWPGVNPGELRHLITIQQQVQGSSPSYDAAGVMSQWTNFTTMYVSDDPKYATDAMRGGQTVTSEAVPLTGHYQPGILPNMRVIHGGSTYVIRGIVNHRNLNVLLTLMCLALGANDQ